MLAEGGTPVKPARQRWAAHGAAANSAAVWVLPLGAGEAPPAELPTMREICVASSQDEALRLARRSLAYLA